MQNAVYQLTDWSQTNAFIDPKSQAQIILFNKLAAETESYVSRGSFIRRLIDKLLAPELCSDDLDEFELVGGAAATSAAATGSAATDSAATGAVSAVPAQDITPPAVRGQPPASEQPPSPPEGKPEPPNPWNAFQHNNKGNGMPRTEAASKYAAEKACATKLQSQKKKGKNKAATGDAATGDAATGDAATGDAATGAASP